MPDMDDRPPYSDAAALLSGATVETIRLALVSAWEAGYGARWDARNAPRVAPLRGVQTTATPADDTTGRLRDPGVLAQEARTGTRGYGAPPTESERVMRRYSVSYPGSLSTQDDTETP